MIHYIEGDIFKSPAQVLVNTVNTVGVMGKGIALEFKKRYPDMFQKYKEICDKRKLRTGSLMLCYEPDHWILLFPTKEHWRNPSRLDYIESGLSKFVRTFEEKGISSIAFPRLGCGNGELNWSDVQPIMERYLKDLPIDIFIYLGAGDDSIPEHKIQEETIDWLRKNAKDMSFQGLEDDIRYNCSIVPYTFTSDNTKWSLLWQNELVFTQANTDNPSLIVNEDDFYDIWTQICNIKIITKNSASSPQRLVQDMLYSLGYLSEVKITNGQSSEKTDGYQINSGDGRVYALKGYADEL